MFPPLSQWEGAQTGPVHQDTILFLEMPKALRERRQMDSMAVSLVFLINSHPQCYLKSHGPFRRVEMTPQKRKEKWTVK